MSATKSHEFVEVRELVMGDRERVMEEGEDAEASDKMRRKDKQRKTEAIGFCMVFFFCMNENEEEMGFL